jgi:streptogramin lyase
MALQSESSVGVRIGALLAMALAACGDDGRETGQTGGLSVGSLSAGSGITSAGGTEGNSSADGDGDGDGSGGVKVDVGFYDLGPGNGGDCPGGGGMMGDDVEFSYIWIANSPAGTVSKIDTRTGVEVGRYATGPATQAEPSRTSVNLYGDVAVSNRGSQVGGHGGVTKIAARMEDCVDLNGNGAIETSNGPASVLPWGTDECVLWNVEIPSDVYQHGPRPTAWEGAVDNGGCAEANPRLWMGYYDYANNTGKFRRLDGATGSTLDEVDVPAWNGLDYGPYGGAVNKDGDFFVIGWQLGPLIRIDGDTLQVDRWAFPPPPQDMSWSYGMSLDQYGNPWVASAGAAAGFDVASQQWTFVHTGNQSMRGVMVDKEDRAWYAVDASGAFGCGLGVVDVKTKQLLAPAITLPGCIVPVGVSIDVDGYVWVVDQGANAAFKIDPDTYQIQLTVQGLTAPYTYSDMTGAGLNLVVNPPAG